MMWWGVLEFLKLLLLCTHCFWWFSVLRCVTDCFWGAVLHLGTMLGCCLDGCGSGVWTCLLVGVGCLVGWWLELALVSWMSGWVVVVAVVFVGWVSILWVVGVVHCLHMSL